jgi:hypothetical protein
MISIVSPLFIVFTVNFDVLNREPVVFHRFDLRAQVVIAENRPAVSELGVLML